MGNLALTSLLTTILTATLPAEPTLRRFEYSRVEMAVEISIVLYADDETKAAEAAEAAFDRIGQLNDILSDYHADSELRRLCTTAGEGRAVAVSPELGTVLSRAREISDQSGGAFDVTVGQMSRLWRRARVQGWLPSKERLTTARELTDYRLVRMDAENRTVELLKAGMRLDLGGIAKGYATDEALAVLRKAGISRALVDAGGDIAMGDPPPDKPGWRIGIARLEADGPPSRIATLSNVAMATSGDTWQYVEIDGTRYSHLVDPRTGLGITDHSNVTVIAPNGITADALASAVSVLGPKRGLELIDRTAGTAALILRKPEGTLETYQSARWKDLPIRHEKEPTP